LAQDLAAAKASVAESELLNEEVTSRLLSTTKYLTVFSRTHVCEAVDMGVCSSTKLQRSPSEYDDTAFNKVEEHNESY